ncbi:hypothetical protein Gotri_027135 [Gossypium trilobum]|uniref:Phosphatidic acid phosphatase type 2/haloperoxidase domain-containing protein n=1 Tax=Gossypium trilobum TaxID=34281 RepID=A0A7J9FPK2_9ROSI|nr:hypothetical protein [Gossypium trilobum]
MYANVGPQATQPQTVYAANVAPQVFPQPAFLPPVSPHKHVAGIPVGNGGVDGWRTGLFDFMDDPMNALVTAFFPCLTFGQIAEIVDDGHTIGKMTEILLGTHTIKSHGVKVVKAHIHNWLILVILVVIDGLLNYVEPFHRFVGQEMMTDLKFPFHGNTVPVLVVPVIAVLVPFIIFGVYYYLRKDIYDFHHAILGILYSVLLSGVITDSIKDAVGRPRPNFFFRCFPDGKAVFDQVTGDVICHGDAKIVKEGYKSFPSGHTSWSFAGLCFLSLYLSGKLRAFNRGGNVSKLCIVIFPVLAAVLVGISRVDDYWHHWTDVFAGALIGTSMAAFCYLQFFPCPHYEDGWAPHAYFKMIAERQSDESPESTVRSPSKNESNDIETQPM